MPTGRISPSDDDRRKLAAIAAALGEIGLSLPGSVAVRSYRCGKARCACHADPPRLHAARLRALVDELEELSVDVISTDPRLKHLSAGPSQKG